MDDVSDCYDEVFTKVVELQGKYSDPMIAGNMMVHALRIYKSILNDEEFESMIDAIAESESKIEPFDQPTLQ